ncbi:hypothetical protein JKA74_03380 [Marivirga sp. S37H4]|uniref:Fibronectin type-III domain-containing protein n=1 Tax=Marivirga aurantiaca TaxID=2802615 RepID=A0A934WW72_9BACT|nr:hypothetical protein [Marivirga aurantiaca]MBK6264067.1 hypothetical protein [Marivirga aurantiaca]
MIHRLIFILLLSISFSLNAQDEDAFVAVTASVEGNDVLLRWAPSTPILWYYSNIYGYTLERYTYKRGGEILEKAEKITLGTDLKPSELDEWEYLANRDDFAAVAAQCIYGESLEVTDGATDVFSIVNKSKEMDSRFSFALVAADQNVEVAKLSGLYFRDENVKEDEYYLYKVYANVPDKIERADTAILYYGLAEFKGLPKPQLLDVLVQDEQVLVAWNTVAFDHIYNYYQIERSEDGENYKILNGLPVVNVESGPRKNKTTGMYVDTTAHVGKHYYRVVARNAFGQTSPASDSLTVEVLPANQLPQPEIIEGENVDNQSIAITWNIPYETELIDEVYLERGKSAKGPFKKIKTVSLNERRIVDDAPYFNNYYRLVVADKYYTKASFPYLVQLIDSIPPGPSEIITATVKDSLVTINWHPNPAKDLMGYRLYKSNFESSESSLLTEELITDTVYQEVIALNNLTQNVFYYLAAIDHVENQSQLSKAVKVVKPDRIPPSPAVISEVISKNDSMTINWKPSGSSDVKNYLLYRKTGTTYTLIGVLSSDKSQYVDTYNSDQKTTITYRLIAIDHANNEGISSPFSTIYLPESSSEKVKYKVIEEEGVLNIYWETEKNNNREVNIYLNNGEHFNLVKVVSFEKGTYSLARKGITEKDLKLIFR